jgi:hypothetical protein
MTGNGSSTGNDRPGGIALALFMLLMAGACGGSQPSATTYHCATSASAPKACIEHRNLTGTALTSAMAGCTTGVWGTGACPRDGLLGGCQPVPDDVEWYYMGGKYATAAEVMTACTMQGATFVAP